MPKKSGKKGKGKGKKKAKKTVAGAEDIVQSFLKCYERNCGLTESQISPRIKSALRACKENETVLSTFILEPAPIEKEGDLPVLLEPLIAAFRQERYVHIQDLYLWNYPMTYENMATVALLLEKGCYPLRYVEFLDCLLEGYSLQRFSRSFNICSTLTSVTLDYNEFGDEGARYFCKGMEGNVTLLSISMCYCDLGVESGDILGKMLVKTAVRELFLDGNNLECKGVISLIDLCAEQAFYESTMRAEEAARKLQEEAEKAEREREQGYRSSGLSGDEDGKDGKKKKKKKGKKKKKKEPPPPPAVGPWIHKLHVADNGIDGLAYKRELAPLQMMRVLKKLIMYSNCFEELDLEKNLIGDIAAKEILESLEHRKETEKLGGCKVRVGSRIKKDTFDGILKLGSGLKKKKKGGKKARK
ncbi:uncharacterized protein LOC133202305 isoform X2 [Saccostrea echinata]|uniref:uncharacterized protein LOC133202305 isoform X2 n=1 Tax=Saccostrea echinata TaxID=191078 RepID=UPI002A80157D|nr:uncharacterized protein LOC133202305 isoform X2 [Saccostrea echinata]